MENKLWFKVNDIFLFGVLDKLSYFENVFLVNLEFLYSKFGLVIRLKLCWEKYGVIIVLKEGEILNLVL